MRTIFLFIAKGLLISCVFLFWGCSLSSKQIDSEQGIEPKPSQCNGEECLPLNLEIIEEVNSGDQLYLLLSVKAYNDWPLQKVAIRLAGYKDGMEVVEEMHTLSELVNLSEGEVLLKGRDHRFVLSLNVKEVSDYQVELLWGNESAHHEPEEASSKGSLVDVADVQHEIIRECEEVNCAISMRITFSIINNKIKLLQELPLRIVVSVPKSANYPVEKIVFDGEFLLQSIGLRTGEDKDLEILLEDLPELSNTNQLQVAIVPAIL